MKKLLATVISFALMLCILPANLSFAEETGDSIVSQAVEQSSILIQLKQKLAQIQYRYTLLEENKANAKINLEEVNAGILNLQGIIANLDAQITDKERQSLNVKSQEERSKMDTSDTEKEITELTAKLEEQKLIVGKFMELLYLKRSVYYSADGINPIKVLASPESISKTLQNITYLSLIEDGMQNHMDQITDLSSQLVEKWTLLREKQGQLSLAYTDFTDELGKLKEEKAHQEEILDELNGEKAILEGMLASSDDNKEELESQIRIYQSNVAMIERSLAETNSQLSGEQQTLIAQIQADLAETYSTSEASGFLQLDWPVSPGLGLSALFHDGGYRTEFGVDHYALDIKAKQGSEIYAPADGVVQDVVYDPESNRYSYITIAHRMGVMTLYGHVSSPAVAIGDFVTRGQMIGLSGGNPHTVGAGVRTTGPHLHFEVWQDGVRVDPLYYLPLGEISMDTLSSDYASKIQDALEAQIKSIY